MPISTRTCRRPGRCTASIRPWTGLRIRTAIVFWAGGKLRRVNRDGSQAAEIPFQVSDTRIVIDPPRAGGRGRAGQRHHPHAALRPGLARRQPRRLRDAWAGSTSATSPAARPAPLTAQDGDFQLFPVLVARRQPDRLRLVERPEARRNPHRRRRRLATCAPSPSSPAITAGRASRPTARPSSTSCPAAAA